MPTTLEHITRRFRRKNRTIPSMRPAEELPLGTCGACEHSLFSAFQQAAPGDSGVWKSADRRREEAMLPEDLPKQFKCRYCGQSIQRHPPPGARMTRIR